MLSSVYLKSFTAAFIPLFWGRRRAKTFFGSSAWSTTIVSWACVASWPTSPTRRCVVLVRVRVHVHVPVYMYHIFRVPVYVLFQTSSHACAFWTFERMLSIYFTAQRDLVLYEISFLQDQIPRETRGMPEDMVCSKASAVDISFYLSLSPHIILDCGHHQKAPTRTVYDRYEVR